MTDRANGLALYADASVSSVNRKWIIVYVWDCVPQSTAWNEDDIYPPVFPYRYTDGAMVRWYDGTVVPFMMSRISCLIINLTSEDIVGPSLIWENRRPIYLFFKSIYLIISGRLIHSKVTLRVSVRTDPNRSYCHAEQSGDYGLLKQGNNYLPWQTSKFLLGGSKSAQLRSNLAWLSWVNIILVIIVTPSMSCNLWTTNNKPALERWSCD